MSVPQRSHPQRIAEPRPPSGTAAGLARDLADALRDHVKRSLGVDIEDTSTSLAFVDHYLRSARTETRPAILLLVAAEAGAWYGELVRREMGGRWIGDGHDPRTLRFLLRDQFLHFAPVDQALEAVLGADTDDTRMPDGPALDTSFHAKGAGAEGRATSPAADTVAEPPDVPRGDVAEDDASWLADRLAELPPVGEDEYYSLTCRFETLQLVLELLAAKHVGEGRSPREYGLEDYTEVGVVGGSPQADAAAD
jgi:hypothetical protein